MIITNVVFWIDSLPESVSDAKKEAIDNIKPVNQNNCQGEIVNVLMPDQKTLEIKY